MTMYGARSRLPPAAAAATAAAAGEAAAATAAGEAGGGGGDGLGGDHGGAHAAGDAGDGVGEAAAGARPVAATVPGGLVVGRGVGDGVASEFSLEVFGPRLLDAQRDGVGQDALEALDRHRRLAGDVEAVLLGGFEIHAEALELVHDLAALHGRGAHQDGEDDVDEDDGGGGDERGVDAQAGERVEQAGEQIAAADHDPDGEDELADQIAAPDRRQQGREQPCPDAADD